MFISGLEGLNVSVTYWIFFMYNSWIINEHFSAWFGKKKDVWKLSTSFMVYPHLQFAFFSVTNLNFAIVSCQKYVT